MKTINEELIQKVYETFCRLQKIDDSKVLTESDKETIVKALNEKISVNDMFELVSKL